MLQIILIVLVILLDPESIFGSSLTPCQFHDLVCTSFEASKVEQTIKTGNCEEPDSERNLFPGVPANLIAEIVKETWNDTEHSFHNITITAPMHAGAQHMTGVQMEIYTSSSSTCVTKYITGCQVLPGQKITLCVSLETGETILRATSLPDPEQYIDIRVYVPTKTDTAALVQTYYNILPNSSVNRGATIYMEFIPVQHEETNNMWTDYELYVIHYVSHVTGRSNEVIILNDFPQTNVSKFSETISNLCHGQFQIRIRPMNKDDDNCICSDENFQCVYCPYTATTINITENDSTCRCVNNTCASAVDADEPRTESNNSPKSKESKETKEAIMITAIISSFVILLLMGTIVFVFWTLRGQVISDDGDDQHSTHMYENGAMAANNSISSQSIGAMSQCTIVNNNNNKPDVKHDDSSEVLATQSRIIQTNNGSLKEQRNGHLKTNEDDYPSITSDMLSSVDSFVPDAYVPNIPGGREAISHEID